MDPLNSLITNRRSNPGAGKCQQILGSFEAVLFWAEAWKQRAHEIEIITMKNVVEYSTDPANKFSYTDMAHYQKGLGDFGSFMLDCAKEVEAVRKLTEMKEKQKAEKSPNAIDTDN